MGARETVVSCCREIGALDAPSALLAVLTTARARLGTIKTRAPSRRTSSCVRVVRLAAASRAINNSSTSR